MSVGVLSFPGTTKYTPNPVDSAHPECICADSKLLKLLARVDRWSRREYGDLDEYFDIRMYSRFAWIAGYRAAQRDARKAAGGAL